MRWRRLFNKKNEICVWLGKCDLGTLNIENGNNMLTAIWLVPDLIKGSGGHRTILHHANYMQQNGWKITLALEPGMINGRNASQKIKDLFGYSFSDVRIGWDDIDGYDAYFATIWYSAETIKNANGHKFYFVQDYEALFYPMGSEYLGAENSYSLGLNHVTIGRWLTYKIRSMGFKSAYFEFSADDNIYYRNLNLTREDNIVCFIHQPEKSRRCAQLGLEALAIVSYYRPDVKIVLYGSNSQSSINFPHENLGLISLEECAKLYNRSSVGLCISASNPSRIPFEMLMCGLPVVDLWRENNLYDFDDSCVVLAQGNAESIAYGILTLLDDRKKREAISIHAQQLTKKLSEKKSSEQFISIVHNYINFPGRFLQGDVCLSYRLPALVAPKGKISYPRNYFFERKTIKKIILRLFPSIIIKLIKLIYSKVK